MAAKPLLAYEIHRLTNNPDYCESELREGLSVTPLRQQFSLAGQDVIRAIHSIPRLYDDCERNELEVYVGRAGATPKHVLARWKEHYDKKDHRQAMVVLTCSTDVVARWENAAVKVLTRLKAEGRLCVKNADSSHGLGRVPDSERLSCIYVTWKRTRAKDIDPCDRRLLDAIARDVARETGVRREQVLGAIEPLTKPQRAFAAVKWHEQHEEEPLRRSRRHSRGASASVTRRTGPAGAASLEQRIAKARAEVARTRAQLLFHYWIDEIERVRQNLAEWKLNEEEAQLLIGELSKGRHPAEHTMRLVDEVRRSLGPLGDKDATVQPHRIVMIDGPTMDEPPATSPCPHGYDRSCAICACEQK